MVGAPPLSILDETLKLYKYQKRNTYTNITWKNTLMGMKFNVDVDVKVSGQVSCTVSRYRMKKEGNYLLRNKKSDFTLWKINVLSLAPHVKFQNVFVAQKVIPFLFILD